MNIELQPSIHACKAVVAASLLGSFTYDIRKIFGILDPLSPLSVPNPRNLPSFGKKLANPVTLKCSCHMWMHPPSSSRHNPDERAARHPRRLPCSLPAREGRLREGSENRHLLCELSTRGVNIRILECICTILRCSWFNKGVMLTLRLQWGGRGSLKSGQNFCQASLVG